MSSELWISMEANLRRAVGAAVHARGPQPRRSPELPRHARHLLRQLPAACTAPVVGPGVHATFETQQNSSCCPPQPARHARHLPRQLHVKSGAHV